MRADVAYFGKRSVELGQVLEITINQINYCIAGNFRGVFSFVRGFHGFLKTTKTTKITRYTVC